MQLFNLLKTCSKLKINQKNLNLCFKIIASNVASVDIVPKGLIELLNFLNINKIGELHA